MEDLKNLSPLEIKKLKDLVILAQQKTLNHFFEYYDKNLQYDTILENLNDFIYTKQVEPSTIYSCIEPEYIVELMQKYFDDLIDFICNINKILLDSN